MACAGACGWGVADAEVPLTATSLVHVEAAGFLSSPEGAQQARAMLGTLQDLAGAWAALGDQRGAARDEAWRAAFKMVRPAEGELLVINTDCVTLSRPAQGLWLSLQLGAGGASELRAGLGAPGCALPGSPALLRALLAFVPTPRAQPPVLSPSLAARRSAMSVPERIQFDAALQRAEGYWQDLALGLQAAGREGVLASGAQLTAFGLSPWLVWPSGVLWTVSPPGPDQWSGIFSVQAPGRSAVSRVVRWSGGLTAGPWY